MNNKIRDNVTDYNDPVDNCITEKEKDLYAAYLLIYFCQCQNNRCTPLLLKRLKIKYNLSLIRVRIAQKRFENVEELLGAAMHKIVTKGLILRDVKCRDCNCSKPNKLENLECTHEGKCRQSCVACKVRCNTCEKFCISSTQNFLKKRIQAHVYNAVKLASKGIHSDSFAKHFAFHFKSPATISAKHIKPLPTVTTINKLDLILASRDFGTDKFQLCIEERIEIDSAWLKDSQKNLINKNTEICGACRHKAKLHVHEQVTPTVGTDEGIESQKKKLDDSVNTMLDNEQ